MEKEKEFDIDFCGCCVIKANSREEAEEKFWAGLQSPSVKAYNEGYQIYRTQEIKEK